MPKSSCIPWEMEEGGKSTMLPIPSGWASQRTHHPIDNVDAPLLSIQTSLCESLVSHDQPPPPSGKKKRGLHDIMILEEVDQTIPTLPDLRKQQQRDVSSMSSYSALESSMNMVDVIRSSIQSSKTFDSRSKFKDLNLDSVLSSTSYKNLMRQTFGSDGLIVPGQAGISPTLSLRVPTITRLFEESYMREPIQHERQCARGLRYTAFIGFAFVALPSAQPKAIFPDTGGLNL